MSDVQADERLEINTDSEGGTQEQTQRQLLDLNESVLEALTALEEAQHPAERRRARRVLKSRLVSEILFVQSALEGTAHWRDATLGYLTFVGPSGNTQRHEFKGLQSIIEFRDGVTITTRGRVESSGDGPDTAEVREEVRPIPGHVLEEAVAELQQWRNSVEGIGIQVDEKESRVAGFEYSDILEEGAPE